MATYTPEPREYELMVLLSPEMGDEALTGEMDRLSSQISGTGAEILSTKSTTPWGRRRLAYPIRNHQDAFYVLYSISSQPGQLDPFERDLKLNNNVLRYLLIKQDKAEPIDEEGEAEEVDEAATEPVSEEQATPETEAGAEESETEDVAEESAEASTDGTEDEQA